MTTPLPLFGGEAQTGYHAKRNGTIMPRTSKLIESYYLERLLGEGFYKNQQELSEDLGVANQTLSNYVRQKGCPPYIERLAKEIYWNKVNAASNGTTHGDVVVVMCIPSSKLEQITEYAKYSGAKVLYSGDGKH